MSPRLRRTAARLLIRLARRLHPIRTLTDLRALNRMDSAIKPEKPRPIEHYNHVHVSEPAQTQPVR